MAIFLERRTSPINTFNLTVGIWTFRTKTWITIGIIKFTSTFSIIRTFFVSTSSLITKTSSTLQNTIIIIQTSTLTSIVFSITIRSIWTTISTWITLFGWTLRIQTIRLIVWTVLTSLTWSHTSIGIWTFRTLSIQTLWICKSFTVTIC